MPWRSGPHRIGALVLPERVAGGAHMPPVDQLERDMRHGGDRGGAEIRRVMIGPTAQEDEEVFQPIGHPKAEWST